MAKDKTTVQGPKTLTRIKRDKYIKDRASKRHKIAEDLISSDKRTKEVREKLISAGFTKSQACDAVTTARKHLGIYKNERKKRKEEAKLEAQQRKNEELARRARQQEEGREE